MTQGETILQISNLVVVYNRAIRAVQGLSLSVAEGSITSILGVNGSGKTSTLKAISGFLKGEGAEIVAGDIVFMGERLNGMRPDLIVRRGLALVPEREKIFTTLSVEENLMVGRLGSRQQIGSTLELVYRHFPILKERRRQVAGYLSGGERQMLAIGRGLFCFPRLLLIDELSMGLAPLIVANLMAVLRSLNKELAITVLLVEQNAASALSVSDYIYIMEAGRAVFEGSPKEVTSHEDIREFYLGTSREGMKDYREARQHVRRRRW